MVAFIGPAGNTRGLPSDLIQNGHTLGMITWIKTNIGWQGLALLIVLVWFARFLFRNADLREHRKSLVIAFAAVFVAFVGGALLGRSTGHPQAGWVAGCVLGGVAFYGTLRLLDRALNDCIGGLLFDLVFSEGPFAATTRPEKVLPNVTLLRHWCEHGEIRKAWRMARRHLVADVRAYPLWLLAMEMAVLHLRQPQTAVRLFQRLQRFNTFSDDQKLYAFHQLKAWAAMIGYELDLPAFDPNRGRIRKPRLLVEADHLRMQGRIQEAESRLEALLRQNPEHLAAALLLMRLLTQERRRRDKAEQLLKRLENRPFVSNAFVEFARRSLDEWSNQPPTMVEKRRSWFCLRRPEPPPGSGKIVLEAPPRITLPTSQTSFAETPHVPSEIGTTAHDVDELLAERRLGTAVEVLERKLREQPADYETWVKLAEVYALHCGNVERAAIIIRRMEINPAFTPEQNKAAATQLKKWREARQRPGF